MSYFIDTDDNVYPDSALFAEEIAVIYAVLSAVIEQFLRRKPSYGTIIIDGQAYGCGASCITRASFLHGDYATYVGDNTVTSADEAAASINDVLKWDGVCTPADQELAQNGYFHVGNRTLPRSGIYYARNMMTLVLNADQGRFLASIRAQDSMGQECSTECELLLDTLARTLGYLEPIDERLHTSIAKLALDERKEQLLYKRHKESRDLQRQIQDAISTLICEQRLPEVKAWRKWVDDQEKPLPKLFG